MEDSTFSFFQWLISCGAQIKDKKFCKIDLHYFEQTGRGCIATHTIEVRPSRSQNDFATRPRILVAAALAFHARFEAPG
jgi:hypothetical protein